jgi:hypothetical protein
MDDGLTVFILYAFSYVVPCHVWICNLILMKQAEGAWEQITEENMIQHLKIDPTPCSYLIMVKKKGKVVPVLN